MHCDVNNNQINSKHIYQKKIVSSNSVILVYFLLVFLLVLILVFLHNYCWYDININMKSY